MMYPFLRESFSHLIILILSTCESSLNHGSASSTILIRLDMSRLRLSGGYTSISSQTLSVSYIILVSANITPQALLNALPLAEIYTPFALTLYRELTDTGHGRMAE